MPHVSGVSVEVEGRGSWDLVATNDTFVGVTDAVVGDTYEFVIQTDSGITERIPDPRASRLNAEGKSMVYDHRAYPWQCSDFQPPALHEAIIYELHPPSFSVSAGEDPWRSLIPMLDYLVELGITVIEITPPTQFGGESNWGYNLTDPYAPAPSLGSPDDLKAFIDEAHQRGIAVIFDWVVNHVDLASPLARHDLLGKAYLYQDERRHTKFGPRPDFEREQSVEYWIGSLRTWLEDYRLDGVRVDATHYVRRGSQPDEGDLSEAWEFFRALSKMLQEEYPGKLFIAEDLQGEPAITRPSEFGGAGFHSQWDPFLSWALRKALTTGNSAEFLDKICEALTRQFDGRPFSSVVSTETHDDARPSRPGPDMTDMETVRGRFPVVVANGAPQHDAYRLSAVGLALTLVAPQVPLLFMGQEFGSTVGFEYPRPEPLDWSERSESLLALTTRLIQLRKNIDGNTSGLMGGGTHITHVNPTDGIFSFVRSGWGEKEKVVVIVNLSSKPQPSYDLGLPRDGEWKVRCETASFLEGGPEADVPVIRTSDNPLHEHPFRGTVTIPAQSVMVLSQD